MKEPVDVNTFQDAALAAFAVVVDHNFSEAICMFVLLQADQRVTNAKVGTTPDGYATIWSTFGGICNMVNQHETLLGGLTDHGARMREVNTYRWHQQSKARHWFLKWQRLRCQL